MMNRPSTNQPNYAMKEKLNFSIYIYEINAAIDVIVSSS